MEIIETMVDLDTDNEKELVVFFNEVNMPFTFAVVTEKEIQAISLNRSDTNFQFKMVLIP